MGEEGERDFRRKRTEIVGERKREREVGRN